MTVHNREEREALIEEIKQAGHEASEGMTYPNSDYPVKAIPYARFLEILAVFEQAHTPTAVEAIKAMPIESVRAELASRRTVTPEPSAEPTDAQVEAFKVAWWTASDEGDHGNKVRRGLRAAYEARGQGL